MTVYISGSITGTPDNNRTAFAEAEKRLRAAGYRPMNPLVICEGLTDYEDCMRRDLAAITMCDAIITLPWYTHSRGVKREHGKADELRIPLVSLDWLETVTPIEAGKYLLKKEMMG